MHGADPLRVAVSKAATAA